MFVKYITESDILARGFKPSNLATLYPESYKLMDVSADNEINTYIQIWIDNNTYKYSVITDLESTIDRGILKKKEQMDDIIFKYITNATQEYRKRCREKTRSNDECTYNSEFTNEFIERTFHGS